MVRETEAEAVGEAVRTRETPAVAREKVPGRAMGAVPLRVCIRTLFSNGRPFRTSPFQTRDYFDYSLFVGRGWAPFAESFVELYDLLIFS